MQETWRTATEDAQICPPLNMQDKTEEGEAEAARLQRAMGPKEVVKEETPNELVITLDGLPAKAGLPVEVSVRGSVFYNSSSLEGTVSNVVIKVPNLQENEVVPVVLKIGVKKFQNQLDVKLADGKYLKLAIEQGSFRIRQQDTKFGAPESRPVVRPVIPALQSNRRN
eukprot:TRINITY_DN11786_c0_g1_i1.p1 TRINITY_DN11786_c0_g1~~TRINITY_DN11786_c0_g1_i1.p1  ORF type:complete len:168 (-),score=36.45 TRINITY_DN11786_c0_g1_i1:36-539(-)